MDPVVKRFKLLWADLKVLIKELELSVEGIFGDDASYNRAAFDLKKARNEAGKLRKELTGADHEGKGIFKGARATAKALADQNAAMRQQADMARDLSSFFANWRPDRVIRAQEAGIRQFQGRMGGAAGLLGANQVASHTDVTAMPAAQPGQPAGQPAIVEVKTAPLSTLTTTSPDVVAAQEEAHGTLQDILKALDSQITVLRQIAGQSGIGPGGGTLSPTISQILNNQNARALFGHAQDPLPARALGHNAGGGT